MKPALLLVDLQNDFLSSGLDEPVSSVVDAAVRLRAGCRARGMPVFHIRLTVGDDDSVVMAHWLTRDDRRCVRGSHGHRGPDVLAPLAGETVVDKTTFSPFVGAELPGLLRAAGIDTVWIAGVHLHACVRATALDAYQRGWAVVIADDAVGSDDPLHAAITRRYLADRDIRFATVAELLDGGEEPRPAPGDDVARACWAARGAASAWAAEPMTARVELLVRFATALRSSRETLARAMAVEVRKPLAMGRAEVERSALLLEAAAGRSDEPLESRTPGGSLQRRVPHGVIAAVTPWNNPVAIPVGKLAPALLYGNAVVWKPSPAAAGISRTLLELWHDLAPPTGLLEMLAGDAYAAYELTAHGDVDAVTFTGGPRGGWALQELCAKRSLPLQAELGGNNAAIVLASADLDHAAREIALGAFGFAGQRCTANRRVIVERSVREPFLERLFAAAEALPCGDPLREDTVIGPLISDRACADVRAVVARCRVLWRGPDLELPAYHPPAIIAADHPEADVVRHETFAPLLVIQAADDLEHALALSNGVLQGLVAALFGGTPTERTRFLASARAGILKLDRSTVGADAGAPFGGWGRSGVGPAEHGEANREFYTRAQAVYDGASGA